MQRDILLLSEMVDAAEQAQRLAAGLSAAEVGADRMRRDSLLWNFTVLGEAATLVSSETKARFPDIPWRTRFGSATASCTATGRLTSRSCTPPQWSSSASSPVCSATRWLLSNRTREPTREVTSATRSSRRGPIGWLR